MLSILSVKEPTVHKLWHKNNSVDDTLSKTWAGCPKNVLTRVTWDLFSMHIEN